MKEVLENWKSLSDEEKARLTAKEPIAKEDATAFANRAGWEAWLASSKQQRETYLRSQIDSTAKE